LQRLAGPGRDPLAAFRDAFQERYEGREVSLMEALNEEIALGRLIAGASDPSPLLRGIAFPKASSSDGISWGQREQHLLTLLGSALEEGRQEIRLDSEDIERLTVPNAPALPPSVEVLATVLSTSAAAADRGDFRLLWHGAYGPPATRFLGRFCHADLALARCVEQLVGSEEREDPEAIYAEVVHLPEGRIGNVLARPQLRGYD